MLKSFHGKLLSTLPNVCLCGLFRRRKESEAVDGPERTCLSRHLSLVKFLTESKGQGISVNLKLKVGKPLLMKKALIMHSLKDESE